MNLWLLLETSGRGGQVGLMREGQLFAARLDPARRHNRDLTSTVNRLLQDAEVRISQLQGVMVSAGPGSFTGLRVGVMSAKMLAYTLGCSLVAVPTFQAIANQSPVECDLVDVLSDGLQGMVYVQRFRRNNPWEAVQELCIERACDWALSLTPEVWLSGPGVGLVESLVNADQPRTRDEQRLAGLQALYDVGLHHEPLNRDDLLKLEPLYLRPSSAEEQANRRAKQL